ncbi:hypothetical protein MRB53_041912 [Persea americana]|nr:hypothetical protein MRB53_041912 [Persea americana]
MKDPSPDDLLPIGDEHWDSQNNGLKHSPGSSPPDAMAAAMPLSTSTDVRVGCFARLAQVTNLLGRTMRNLYEPTPDMAYNQEEATQLKRTLEAYSTLLPVEATASDCRYYCAPISICLQ